MGLTGGDPNRCPTDTSKLAANQTDEPRYPRLPNRGAHTDSDARVRPVRIGLANLTRCIKVRFRRSRDLCLAL